MNATNSAPSSPRQFEILTRDQARAKFAALDRYEAKQSLSAFVPLGWHVLEPTQVYVPNWHIDAMCDHLEAVTYGWVNRLLINVPPGSSKSLLSSVFWPSWEWGPRELTSLRYLATAFNDGPVKRDTRKMRDLVLSRWYQERWPHVRLTRAGETSFANSSTGSREGVPFGSLTSQRGDRLIIDDPHSTKTAESPAERATTVRLFREGALNRLNDQARSAIIIIMQRLHEGDVSGEVIANDMGYTHLNLPMEYDPAPFVYMGKTLFDPKKRNEIGFMDPRTEPGELLDPARMPADQVAALKKGMGAYAYSGQYQQRAVPREGGLFKRHWFDGKILKPEVVPRGIVWYRHWDLAATKDKNAAYSAGVKMGLAPDGRIIVASSKRLQEEGDVIRQTIRSVAQTDTVETRISLAQDPGQAGKVQKSDMIKFLVGFVVVILHESSLGDKERRAAPFAVQCEAGNVYLVEGEWNEPYLEELCLFPGGKFKDQVDASSGAFSHLVLQPAAPVFGTYGR